MRSPRKTILLLVLLCIVAAALSACEQTASNLTDRAINNLENEVGGAAERASENAGDQAGGLVCGAPLAMLFLPLTIFASASFRRRSKRKKDHGLKAAARESREYSSELENPVEADNDSI